MNCSCNLTYWVLASSAVAGWRVISTDVIQSLRKVSYHTNSAVNHMQRDILMVHDRSITKIPCWQKTIFHQQFEPYQITCDLSSDLCNLSYPPYKKLSFCYLKNENTCMLYLVAYAENFHGGWFHSVAHGGHLVLVCAVCGVTIWRHIPVSRPDADDNPDSHQKLIITFWPIYNVLWNLHANLFRGICIRSTN